MDITFLSSREFNLDPERAKRASADGPVFITDRGRPSHVLLSIAEYERLTGKRRSLVESLSMPGLPEIDLDPPRSGELPRGADLS